MIIAEANYNYSPLIFNYFITSAFDLQEKFYLKPRNASCVHLRPDQLCDRWRHLNRLRDQRWPKCPGPSGRGFALKNN